MPKAPAAEYSAPGANRPVRIIGSKASSNHRLETPNLTHISRKNTLSIVFRQLRKRQNQRDKAVKRSVIGRFINLVYRSSALRLIRSERSHHRLTRMGNCSIYWGGDCDLMVSILELMA
mmetsp:Transcript_1871/g.4252  ORF Transcript_1871/g.4252 Transcript_1871/m.4252 type:complete len:119 (-) Transcript_1871:1362-1718(-)